MGHLLYPLREFQHLPQVYVSPVYEDDGATSPQEREDKDRDKERPGIHFLLVPQFHFLLLVHVVLVGVGERGSLLLAPAKVEGVAQLHV